MPEVACEQALARLDGGTAAAGAGKGAGRAGTAAHHRGAGLLRALEGFVACAAAPTGQAGMSLFAAAPELECKICYEAFDGRERRPKLLGCQHRACARCLRRLARAGELSGDRGGGGGGGGALSCPFCRRETPLLEKDVARLPDDGPALALLLLDRRRPRPRREEGGRGRAGSAPLAPEVLLCPGAVAEASAGVDSASSECLVVTVLEVPAQGKAAAAAAAAPGSLLEVMRLYRPASLASVRCYSPLGKRPLRPGRAGAWRGLARFLLAFLALVYFCSLPFGVYLLLVERLQLGIVLVSLVPSTLLLCLFYSLCQCLCHEIFHPPS
uniref:E3 ubiquitin-protein ligase RNF182 n=1 Tax=Pogona vitticeps TaxID=103695 RepID=A0ABM5G4S5_9SAUR